MNREAELKRDIAGLDAVTAEFITAAGELLLPSNARAREEVIELLGINYVGPESLGRLLYGDENKFPRVELDYVKLKEILNESDEWDSTKKKFEAYALVFKAPISFLELKVKANEAASAQGKTPAFRAQDWYDIHPFTTAVTKSGSWELVRRETVPGSTDTVMKNRKALIADKPNLTPTSFSALAALLVGQYLEHDNRLYNGEWHFGRTSTCAAFGNPVSLGFMDAYGAEVPVHDYARTSVGLSVSRNIN